jgi:aryl-alcohol dehydrogenase
MKVQAAVISAYGQPFEVKSLEMGSLGEDEVLVRLIATGICHSDIASQNGAFAPPLPMVLGHEGAGIVEEVGANVTHVKRGDHVVLSYASCGACGRCGQGEPQYCDEFGLRNFKGYRPNREPTFTDGDQPVWGGFFGQSSFATFALATARNTVKVARHHYLESLGPLGCGLQTGAGTVLNSLKPQAGDSLVVFGVGTVGMAAMMAAVASDCGTVVAVDVHDGRLELARELGATHAVRGDAADLMQQLRAILPAGATFSVDTSGKPSSIRAAIDVLAVRGTCAVLAVAPGTEVTFMPSMLLAGRTVMGITEGDADPQEFIPRMIALHEAGRFPFDRLITYYELGEINEAIADMRSGRTIKPVLRMSH